ncbi:hypothetical protein PI125_g20890 [Phytophthora idaei]|nr:hypothetical protein PI125_g20890 [Phytophthora idaei]
MDAEDVETFNCENEKSPLGAEESAQVRAVLGSQGNLEETINLLQRDHKLMFESVGKFANRTEHRQHENLNKIKANQELLQQVISQLQQFAQQNESRESTQVAVIAQLQSEVATLRDRVQVLTTMGPHVAEPATYQASAKSEDELEREWDVLGARPSHTPVYDAHELENLVAKCHKQRETPIYVGEADEDIEVYVFNMIRWYAAYQLYFHQERVDMRVGQLMVNHAKGKAKAWNRSLDTYRDELRRLTRTAGVSEYIKILRCKQGLSSTQLLHLLKTKSFETLDELIEASRTLNPSEAGKPTEKGGNKGNKMSTPSAEKKTDIVKCTSLQCTENGHTKERCWMLHPEPQPEWLKDSHKRKGKGAAGVSKTSEGGETDKLWSVLFTIQSGVAQLKGDLN